MDYYVLLGIAEDADEETIRSAFRALARRYHPDVGAGSSPIEFQRAREAYETLAAIYLRQGDFYQAYEMFDSAIRNGGKATFSMMHDHTRGNFDAGEGATCVGELTLQPAELTFESADGHRFATSWAELREAGSNRFFGSSIGGFHVKVTADGKSRNFNLAPRSRDKREANIILDLLIENAQRQDSGR